MSAEDEAAWRDKLAWVERKRDEALAEAQWAKRSNAVLRDRVEAAEAERDLLKKALEEIDARHIPDQPAAYGGDELEWALRQHTALRQIARAVLSSLRPRPRWETEA